MLRRLSSRSVVGRSVAAVPLAAIGQRSVYTIYGSTICDPFVKDNPNNSIIPQPHLRCHAVHSVPEVINSEGVHICKACAAEQVGGVPITAPTHALAESEVYLRNAIEEDIKRLSTIDWTVEFDGFWKDAIASHQMLFEVLYVPNRRPLRKFIFGNFSHHAEAVEACKIRLSFLRSMIELAETTEKLYTAIFNTRFDMQREIFDPLQREKLLAACYCQVDEWVAQVPSEFQRKVKMELELPLSNLRHWVNGAPNAKMSLSRRLA